MKNDTYFLPYQRAWIEDKSPLAISPSGTWVSVAPAGAVDAAKQYLFYDAALAANETKNLELDLRLCATDLLRIYTPGANVAFTLFGIEEI